jgi:hypothetical protein
MTALQIYGLVVPVVLCVGAVVWLRINHYIIEGHRRERESNPARAAE